MPPRRIRIRSVGRYLPTTVVTAAALDERMGLPPGTVAAESGVLERRYAGDELASSMGAKAARQALEAGGLALADVDLILGACGTPEQAIPCNAALIQRALGAERSGIPAFDVNSTCLSFLTALDVASCLIEAGRYRRVLVVSADIASVGLDWQARESAMILGDGAAAAVVEASPADDPAAFLACGMQTYSEGADLTRIRGGGSRHHPREHRGDLASYAEGYCLFEMDGRAVFKRSAAVLPGFLSEVLGQAGLSLDDVALVVPHQASPSALELMRRRLGLPPERWLTIAHDHGNTVAASIPLALEAAVREGRLRRGDTALLLGTSAGFSVGALAFRY
ncbi:MAG: beta-ketoacyl-ACP synthase 3 [Candidatus Sericytochromatia bacterium]|nr:beta-ketoacyl-ACP synthase 3 [Candidatus Sericytochromatia bacterium]